MRLSVEFDFPTTRKQIDDDHVYNSFFEQAENFLALAGARCIWSVSMVANPGVCRWHGKYLLASTASFDTTVLGCFYRSYWY